MYEHRREQLVPRKVFYRRIGRHGCAALAVAAAALFVGVAGYHWIVALPWVDALLNASMILGGMGPVDPVRTAAGKLFASFYALFSGLVFLTVAGILSAPFVHRFLHRFHLEAEDPAPRPPRRKD